MSSTLAEWARFPEDSLVLLTAQRPHTRFGREPWIGGLVSAFIYGLIGVWVVPQYGAIGDALARIANAYYVLFSRDPHPAAIGFDRDPLPSLLALPLLALKSLWPDLARHGVAANLVSAAFGSLGVVFLLRILQRIGLSSHLRWAIAALFALNPAVIFYAVNGMTDLMMGATMLAAIDGLWGYLEEGRSSDLMASGAWVAVGSLIRYEIIVWVMVVAAFLAFGLTRLPLHGVSVHRHGDWIGGLLLFWLAPMVCAMTTWIFLNWVIKGNPLYFLQASYGETAGVIATKADGYAPVTAARGNIGVTLAYIARQTLLFPPVIVGIAGLLTFGLWGRYVRHTRALILVAATVGVPLLHLLLVYQGISAGWLRFFLSFILFGFVSLVYGARLVTHRRWRQLVWGGCLVALAAGDGVTYAMLTPSSPLRYERLTSFGRAGLLAVDPVIAYIDAHPTLSVLADSYYAFPILLGVQRPAQFIITSDRNFESVLRWPFGRTNAFLVPQPTLARFDAINRLYPRLWKGDEPWAQLIADFPGGLHWRLYVIPPRPTVTSRPTPNVAHAHRAHPDHAGGGPS